MRHDSVAVNGIQPRHPANFDIKTFKFISHGRFIGEDDCHHGETPFANVDAAFAHVTDESTVRLLEKFWPSLATTTWLHDQKVCRGKYFIGRAEFVSQKIAHFGCAGSQEWFLSNPL